MDEEGCGSAEEKAKTKHRSQFRSTKQGFVKKNVGGFRCKPKETLLPVCL